MMTIEDFRNFCLSLEGTQEDMKWDHLCFTVEDKIFVIIDVEAQRFSLKCDTAHFDELVERDGISQAPHFAKGQWISIANLKVLKPDELKQFIMQSRTLVIAKLPKTLQRKYGILV